MQLLNVETILIVNVLFAIVCVILSFNLWKNNKNSFQGLNYWLMSFVFELLTYCLVALRGKIPDIFSIVVANVIGLTALFCFLKGAETFFDKKNSNKFNYLLIVIYTFLYYIFTYIDPSLSNRIITLSLFSIIMIGQTTWLFLFEGKSRKLKACFMLGTVFSVTAFVYFLRGTYVIYNPFETNNFLQTNSLDIFFVLLYMVANIFIINGLYALVSECVFGDLLKEKEKFQKAFVSSSYAMLVTNIETSKIIEINKGFEIMSGYKKDEVIGKKTLDDLHLWVKTEDRETVVSELKKNGEMTNGVFNFRLKTGRIITGLMSAQLIEINGEKCVLSSINDITDRKDIEAEIRKINAELQEKVSELEKMNKLMVNRELKMAELKEEIKHLEENK